MIVSQSVGIVTKIETKLENGKRFRFIHAEFSDPCFPGSNYSKLRMTFEDEKELLNLGDGVQAVFLQILPVTSRELHDELQEMENKIDQS